MSELTDNQINNIVSVIINEHGTLLSRDEVTEIIALILENISGFEVVNQCDFIKTINDIRSLYYESVDKNWITTKTD